MKYDISNIFCPRCDEKWIPGPISEMYLEEDLDSFGKYVATCPKCRKLFLIREEGEGPFATR